ncbi:MAG TPA: serine hydrolase [Verrucomicrobiae bacterium]|nr:serine hydrolase [Verrucomicrobiae bacterium]
MGANAALQDFDGFVEGVIKDWNVPGLAVGVVQSNQTIYAKGFGYRDLQRKLPVTSNTLFAIGSTTKAYTCALLGILSDEGKLDWDTPVRQYIPEFRLRDPHATELTTPRDLVTHRTGLPRHDAVWYNNNSLTRREIVQRLAYLEPSHTFRQKFQYNNMMYVAAGHLIETVTGQSWEENIRRRIFVPLGMTNSNFSVRDSQKATDFALPYRQKDDVPKEIPFRNIDLVGPAGSINSSITEMIRWLRLNVDQGKFAGQQIIKAGTLADIHSPQMATGATVERPDISQATYCLGWGIETYRGHRLLAHGGGIDGFITQVAILPDDGLGVVVFANMEGTSSCTVVLKHAIDRVLGLPPVDWRGEMLEKVKKGKETDKEAKANKSLAQKSGTQPSHSLGDYAGEFEHPGYGRLQIKLREEKLDALFNRMPAALEHWHYDVFNAIKDSGDDFLANQKFNFITDLDGNISGVAVNFEAAVDPILFKRQIDPRMFDTNYLARFVGQFEISGHIMTIAMAGTSLKASVPGEPEYELVPKIDGSFGVKDHSTFVLKFVNDGDNHVTAVEVQRPGGVVRAPRKT